MSFRKRKNPVMGFSLPEVRIVNRKVGEEEFVSTEIPTTVDKLLEPSPSLDDMLKAGVSVKDVMTDGILDSYDENDYPIAEIEEKIINSKSKKSKKGDKE